MFYILNFFLFSNISILILVLKIMFHVEVDIPNGNIKIHKRLRSYKTFLGAFRYWRYCVRCNSSALVYDDELKEVVLFQLTITKSKFPIP